MRGSCPTGKESVAGGTPRILGPTSARHFFFEQAHSTRPAPQPFRSVFFLDTPDALLEGLRCLRFSARSLPRT